MILVEKMTEILNYGKQSLYLMVCLSILKSQTAWSVFQPNFERMAGQIHQFWPLYCNLPDAIRSGLLLTLYLKGLSTQYLSLLPYMHLRFDTRWYLCCSASLLQIVGTSFIKIQNVFK